MRAIESATAVDGWLEQLARVVRHRLLRRLGFSFGLFAIAEHATWLAVTVFAFDRGGVGEAGLIAVVQLAPAVLVAPFAAYAGDRFRKDLVLTAGYAIQAACMLATAFAMWRDAPAVLVYGAATATAVAVTFTRPGMGALLPAATSTPADLTAANVGVGVLEHVGVFLGPALSGLLLQRGGSALVFVVMGAAMVVSAASVSRLRLDEAVVAPHAGIDASDVVDDALSGFRTLARRADLRVLVIVLGISAVVNGASDVLFVAVADGLFDTSTAGRAGLLGAAFGLGALAGALGSFMLVGRSRLAAPLAVAVVTSGASLAVMGGMSHLAPVVVLFVLTGAGDSVARIAGSSILQRSTPGSVLCRVLGVMEGLQMAALAVGAIAVSLLVSWVGLRTGLLLMGLAVPLALATRARRLLGIDAAAPAPPPGLVHLVAGNPIFANLPPPILERLLAASEPVALGAGVDVIRQGDEGDRYYLVERGELTVVVDDLPVRDVAAGGGFGELALLRDVPRTATVTTRTAVRLHSVRRDDFLAALSGRPGGVDAARADADRLLDDTERHRRHGRHE